MVIDLNVRRVKKSRLSEIDFDNLPFGRVFSDHMVEIDYASGEWQEPSIVPYAPLSLSPSLSALHYGQSIFEGMKCHVDANNGDLLLFRPEANAERLNRSAKRMDMPQLPVEMFMTCLRELLDIDRQWVPNRPNTSLYIRPFMFATDGVVGVHSSESYKFIIFTCPVGPYYSQPVKVLVADEFVRAFPGGTGEAKCAGNYGATMYPASLAKKQGYDQILWMDATNKQKIDESGTMNVMFVIDNVLITPVLDGTILDGITRASLLELAQDLGYTTQERDITISEVLSANENGTLQDAFGAGTAATIAPIAGIGYKDNYYSLPPVEGRTVSAHLKRELDCLKRGISEDRFGWIVRI